MDTQHIAGMIPGATVKQKAIITILELNTPGGPVIAVNTDFDPKIENGTQLKDLPLAAKTALAAVSHISDMAAKPPPINN